MKRILLCIATGLCCLFYNPWTLGFLFSQDGSLSTLPNRMAGVVFTLFLCAFVSFALGKGITLGRFIPSALSFPLALGLWHSLFPSVLPRLSPKFEAFLERPYSLLLQDSKKRGVPKRYTLVVGDSHAHGNGDACQARRNRCHSIPWLHEKLNEDFISLGYPGRSSLGALVAEPSKAYPTLRSHYQLEDPQEILVYFYEGNDLVDNLTELGLRGKSLEQVLLEASSPGKVLPFPNSHLFLAKVASSVLFGTGPLENRHSTAVLYANSQRIEYASEPGFNEAKVTGAWVSLPQGLQGPALELNEEETNESLEVFEASLRNLQLRFTRSPIRVVYIPSVLASYQLRGPLLYERQWHSKSTLEGHTADSVFNTFTFEKSTTEELELRHLTILQEIQRRSEKVGAKFLDLTPAFRSASQSAFLHGPQDWKHPNDRGYQVLAEALSGFLRTNRAPSSAL